MSTPLTNYQILAAYLSDSEYADRIPELTRDNITAVGNAIMEYAPARNEFINALVNLIGLQFVSGFNYSNKFASLKGEPITYGDTIEDIYVDAVPADAYNAADDNPHSQKHSDGVTSSRPDIKALFHTIDRELVYKQTINDNRLRRAFKAEFGLDGLIQGIFSSMQGSKELDEYIMTKEMIAANYANATSDAIIPVTNDDNFAWNALNEIKRLSSDISYASRKYNKLASMQFTPKSEQVLVIQKDVKRNIDMNVLAGRPNLENLQLDIEVIEVDDFNENVNKIFAVILDKRGIRIHDALNTQESIRNPAALSTNYFLHLWQLMSFAYFRNVVYFTLVEPEPEPEPEPNQT